MSEILFKLADPVVVIPLLAGLAIFALASALSVYAQAQQARWARIRAAARRRGTGAASAGHALGEAGDPLALVRRIVHRVNVMKDRRGEAIQQKLARAGWRARDAQTIYLFAKLALPFVAALVATALVFVFIRPEWSLSLRLAAVVGTALAFSRLPEMVVRNRAEKRAKAMRKALPDALDLMVICAEAGLSLDAALNRVSREIGPASPALQDELSVTLLELRFLPDRRQALENLARRADLKPVQALVNTLFQTEKFGTPLAQALRVLAGEMRTERMLRAEEKAARLPAIMTVPLIVFILPALFVVLMGPAILDIGEVLDKM